MLLFTYFLHFKVFAFCFFPLKQKRHEDAFVVVGRAREKTREMLRQEESLCCQSPVV